jgi:hypothetical protein
MVQVRRHIPHVGDLSGRGRRRHRWSAPLLDQLADAAPTLLRDGAPGLWLDLAELLADRGSWADRAAELCIRAAAHARTAVYASPDRLELLCRAADIAGTISPVLGRRLFDQAVDAAAGINDDAARLLSVHADLAHRAVIAAEERAQCPLTPSLSAGVRWRRPCQLGYLPRSKGRSCRLQSFP